MRTLIHGVPIVPVPHLAKYPTPGEDARRMVRHGYAEILAWLGEEVGPEPGVPDHPVVIAYDPVRVLVDLDLMPKLVISDSRSLGPTWRWRE